MLKDYKPALYAKFMFSPFLLLVTLPYPDYRRTGGSIVVYIDLYLARFLLVSSSKSVCLHLSVSCVFPSMYIYVSVH